MAFVVVPEVIHNHLTKQNLTLFGLVGNTDLRSLSTIILRHLARFVGGAGALPNRAGKRT